jgi:transposase InsO family protein
LVSKAFRAGFYWPTAGADASTLVQRCPGYQVFAKQSHMPPTALRTIPITWPFAVWGLDMVRPLKGGSHKNKYLLVMVDKFTKWIEAKLVTSAEAVQVIGFISGLVHRYGVPHSLITDNGTNFTAKEVKAWCKKMGIKLDYASVYHPQSNGQVERANGLILSEIKPRLVRSLKKVDYKWVEELDSVLWGLRTTPNRSMGYTPFLMVYGAEAVLPCDIIHDAPRVRMYEELEAELDRQDALDALKEERNVTRAWLAIYQQQARCYHGQEVRAKEFNVGDLVMRLHPEKQKHKLSPRWDGPFIIHQVLIGGAYRIRDPEDGRLEPHPWNAALLRRFYA